MSLNGIFELFGFPEDGKNSKETKKMRAELDEFKKTPYFKLGMFYKLIMNGQTFKKQVLNFFSKADPSLDMGGRFALLWLCSTYHSRPFNISSLIFIMISSVGVVSMISVLS